MTVQQQPRPAHATGLTLAEYYETVYVPTVLLGRSARWIDEARQIVNVITRHFGREILLTDMTDRLAADHFQWLLAKGRRPATVNKHLASWFAIWRHAHEAGLVPAAPRIKKLRAELGEPDAWSIEEMNRILAAAARFHTDQTYFGVPRNLWWTALLRVLWYTALRRASLLAIRRADVDLQTATLYVPPTAMKNKRGKKFRLGGDAIEAIARIWQPDRELLFPHLKKCSQFDHFALILADAQVPPGRHPAGLDKFHKVRRSVATCVAAAAGEQAASSLLGHSSLAISRRYIDPSRLPGNDATQFLPNLAADPFAGAKVDYEFHQRPSRQ